MTTRLRSLLSQFNPFRRRRPARRVTTVATITAAELEARFQAAPENPLWLATLAVLDAQANETVNEAIEPGLSDAALRERIGGVRALLELRAVFEDYEARARQTEEQGKKENSESAAT